LLCSFTLAYLRTYLLVPLELPLSLPLGGLPILPPGGEFDGGVAGVVAVGDDDESGAGVDGVAGAVLTGAASLGVLEVVGAGGVASFFLHPARAANTTAVANIVLRINIGLPL
jgi:hypothetical protein